MSYQKRKLGEYWTDLLAGLVPFDLSSYWLMKMGHVGKVQLRFWLNFNRPRGGFAW